MSDSRSTRRQYLGLASAAGVGALAGCSSDDSDESNADDELLDGPNSDTDDEGDGPGSPTEPLTIGHISPEESPLGIGSYRAAQIAVEEINAEDDGLGVELETADTQARPSEAQTAVEMLIYEDDVDVIVGGFSSEVARQVITLTSEADVPYLSTGPQDPRLSTDFVGEQYDKYKNYFRVGPLNAELQTEVIRDYCVHLSDRHGWNSLTFYRDDAAWAEPYGRLLPDLLRNAGLTIEASAAVTTDSPDLRPLISETRESGADYVLRFFAYIQNAASQLLGPWHDAQYDFGVEGIHVSGMHPEFDRLTQGVCVYEGTGQYGAGGAAAITEHTQQFVQDYREFAGGESPATHPMSMGFGTHDAVHLLADVAAEMGTTTFDENLDAFVDEMLSTEPGRIPAVAGDLEFYGPDGKYPHDLRPTRNASDQITNYPITQWQPNDGDRPGSIECVYPTEIRTAEHLQPVWMR